MMTLLHNLHELPDFADLIRVVAASIQIHPRKAEVERRNQLLQDLEVAHHQVSKLVLEFIS